MFDQLKNLASLMGNAKEVRRRMEAMQAELGRQTVEADAGAGAVRVTANGKLEIVGVRFDPVMIATLVEGTDREADRQMIEDLVTAATNAALAKARELVQQEMAKITGGLDLSGFPGMDQLTG
ncbi:MAG: YbaB/EbfC family nucleoid-associated protein [Phycisphaera sp.]|nr:YbaB/EbfC family nucleoid-associated protein [Phycisphaera sp.]